MRHEIKVPSVGELIQEVQIGKWLKQEGQSIGRDENLVEIESDKATVDLPAPVAGAVVSNRASTRRRSCRGAVIAYVEGRRAGGASGAGGGPGTPATAASPAPPAPPPCPVRGNASAERAGATHTRAGCAARSAAGARSASCCRAEARTAARRAEKKHRIAAHAQRRPAGPNIVHAARRRRRGAKRSCL